MTHDELLLKINSLTCCSGAHELALCAVVELHEPYGDMMCVVCEGIDYPCSTIKAIEKELNNV